MQFAICNSCELWTYKLIICDHCTTYNFTWPCNNLDTCNNNTIGQITAWAVGRQTKSVQQMCTKWISMNGLARVFRGGIFFANLWTDITMEICDYSHASLCCDKQTNEAMQRNERWHRHRAISPLNAFLHVNQTKMVECKQWTIQTHIATNLAASRLVQKIICMLVNAQSRSLHKSN